MYQLVIGNKNYSSWSLRPWLLMKEMNIDFDEVQVALATDKTKELLKSYSGSAKVPVLIHDGITIWDSIAICEYLSEYHPSKALWPFASESRAIARSVTAEMHSGFTTLRNDLPMNCRLSTVYQSISPELQADIDRISEIWQFCRHNFGEQGDFLFGNFSIADAMYAPVVLRFKSYGITVGKPERDYMDKMLSLPSLQTWINEGKQEIQIIDHYELKSD